jgi:hypothetical protein
MFSSWQMITRAQLAELSYIKYLSAEISKEKSGFHSWSDTLPDITLVLKWKAKYSFVQIRNVNLAPSSIAVKGTELICDLKNAAESCRDWEWRHLHFKQVSGHQSGK